MHRPRIGFELAHVSSSPSRAANLLFTFWPAQGRAVDVSPGRSLQRADGSSAGERIAKKIIFDLAWALERRNDLRVVVVQDGAPQMWNIMRAAFERFNIPIGFEVLDWYHASERIAACLLLVQKGDRRRLALREKWNERFFNDESTAARFIASLKRRTAALSKAARSELNYFAERKHLMNYAKLRKQNIPIGSGATEGACKSLIAACAKRSGQRWSRQGLKAVLNLRAVHQSQRCDPFWKLFVNE